MDDLLDNMIRAQRGRGSLDSWGKVRWKS